MSFRQAIETRRLRLLRIIAGLVLAVAFLSLLARPLSHCLFRWVDSILSRAELAAQYFLIAEARAMAERDGIAFDLDRLLTLCIRDRAVHAGAVSVDELRRRLTALRRLLDALPYFALRLLGRGTEDRVERFTARGETLHFGSWSAWRLARGRIERPPDKTANPLRPSTSPRNRAGGEAGWGVLTSSTLCFR